MKLITFLLSVLLASYSFAQESEKIKELTSRIEALEKHQEDLFLNTQGSENHVRSFLKDNLIIGGFLDAGVTHIEGPDTDLQVMNSSNLLGLNIAADFSQRLHFVSQLLTGLVFPVLNPHNNPAFPSDRKFGTVTFGAVLTQAYLEYSFSNKFKIQGGIGYAPFGYALQQRELVLFARRGGPQLLRTQQLTSSLWNGIHLLGNLRIEDLGKVGYDLYTTNPIDPTHAQTMGVGGRVWASSTEEKIIAGLSAQAGKYKNDTDTVYGADIRMNFGNFVLVSEYATHQTDGIDPWNAYVQPGFFVDEERWLLFAFGDYSNSPLSKLSSAGAVAPIADPYKKWEYGAGVNWLPTAYTRIRLTFTRHDYVDSDANMSSIDKDYNSLDLSAGVAF